MKILHKLFFVIVAVLITACNSSKKIQLETANKYSPVSKEIYDEIVSMDSIFFEAYNTCKLDVMASILSDNIEFYHDQGGLSTSKKDILEALKNNICGKVTRELQIGSIEVYPIPGYGAVEMGIHGFHNNQEKTGNPTRFAKFVQLWHNENGQWRMTRVISLH
ncbi:MAG: nuclear transport factor 2 family protein [Sediminibacterium sp.]|nr:nuclear transport factor 2 family protein [Sediminibacterium sp.]